MLEQNDKPGSCQTKREKGGSGTNLRHFPRNTLRKLRQAIGNAPFFHGSSGTKTDGISTDPAFHDTGKIIEDIRPHFDVAFYRRSNRDLRNDEIDLVRHYVEFGAAEGRDPAPNFNTNFYVSGNNDVAASGINPLWHYVMIGKKEGRLPQRPEKSAEIVEEIRPHFDEDYYRHAYKDLDKEDIDFVRHYVEYGADEGRNPSAEFNTRFYLERYPDIAESGVNPFWHFVTRGREEGREGRPESAMERSPGMPFYIFSDYKKSFMTTLSEDPKSAEALEGIRAFDLSEKMMDLIAKAAELEPEIGAIDDQAPSYCAPWHDHDFLHLRRCIDAIPEQRYDSVILMPAGRMGGADLVAAILAGALASQETVLILRTDDPHWERDEWFPSAATSIDISEHMNDAADKTRLLYCLLGHIGARNIYNVNSRRAFETFVRYGSRLAYQFNLHVYYFCADRTEAGHETGYPVQFFSNIFPHLTSALTDTEYLSTTLVERFGIPGKHAERVQCIYTPAMTEIPPEPVAVESARSSATRRPCLLWAGRLDRQKRFDLVVEVAKAMPDVDFRCWGKAVLDSPPDLDALPDNLEMNEPFSDYDELPLNECDGFFYTSAWDGLPTLLIELGGLGVPIAASAVGGVPELIDETTGWPFAGDAGAEEAVAALRQLLADGDERVRRATALQHRIRDRHNMDTYRQQVFALRQGVPS